MRERIVIVGAGGFGREVFHLIDKKQYEPVGFIDIHAKNNVDLPLPVIGSDSLIPDLKTKNISSCICIAIGDMKKRKIIFEASYQYDLLLPPIVHSSAVILTSIPLSAGVIIYPNVVVMNECRIGKSVLLNSGVTLGHDVKVGEFSNINPGAHLAGRIKVGNLVMIGIGSSIREKVQLGDRSIIGAGSLVLNDVPNDTTVYGIPAKVQNTRI